jgi:hypothetical protein
LLIAAQSLDSGPFKEQIRQIKEAFGTPSISCGVLYHGQVIFRHEYATRSASRARLRWLELLQEWETKRMRGTRTRDPADYAGTYTNEGFKITIRVYLVTGTELGVGENPELPGFLDADNVWADVLSGPSFSRQLFHAESPE